jgi:transposase
MFNRLVKECLCQKNSLTIAKTIGSSRQAHEYMLAYKAIEDVQQEVKEENEQIQCHTQGKKGSSPSSSQSSTKQSYTPFDMNHDLIEKTIKTYKSHCNAATFDFAFVKGLKGLDNKKATIIKKIIMKMDSTL